MVEIKNLYICVMVDKGMLHLGQAVIVGTDRTPAVIDSLTQTFAGVIVQGGGYKFLQYEDIALWEYSTRGGEC